MSWLKKATHGIAHTVGKAAEKITGSSKVGEIAEKGFRYATPALGTLGTAYQAAHVAGHLQDKIQGALNPQIPAAETPAVEMPDYSEYLEAMNGYIEAMQAAMTREEPAQEPLKQAQVSMDAARDDTARKQLLRRGLMSQFTRYGSQGGTQRLGA